MPIFHGVRPTTLTILGFQNLYLMLATREFLWLNSFMISVTKIAKRSTKHTSENVWKILRTIPYGTTRSYQQQADILGNPKAVRAVANANGLNKISIIIPCHRVIGTNGTLTGYSGGIWRKQKLLELEKAILF